MSGDFRRLVRLLRPAGALLALCLAAAPGAAADKPGDGTAVTGASALERRADALLLALEAAVAARDDEAYAAHFRADYRDDDGTTREAERRILSGAWNAAPELRLRAKRLALKELPEGFELTAATALVTHEGARAETVAYLVDGGGLIYRARFLDGDVDARERKVEEKLAAKRPPAPPEPGRPGGWISPGRDRNVEKER